MLLNFSFHVIDFAEHTLLDVSLTPLPPHGILENLTFSIAYKITNYNVADKTGQQLICD